MAAGVAGVLLETPAGDNYSPPIPDLICDYQQYLFFPSSYDTLTHSGMAVVMYIVGCIYLRETVLRGLCLPKAYISDKSIGRITYEERSKFSDIHNLND